MVSHFPPSRERERPESFPPFPSLTLAARHRIRFRAPLAIIKIIKRKGKPPGQNFAHACLVGFVRFLPGEGEITNVSSTGANGFVFPNVAYLVWRASLRLHSWQDVGSSRPS